MTALMWGKVPVPWTAPWTGEERRPYIRSERWCGQSIRVMCDGEGNPGAGKPIFSRLHNERSRCVLKERICQICRRVLGGRIVCLNSGEIDRITMLPLINDGLPMCEDCLSSVLTHCPVARRRAADGIVRAWHAEAWLFAPVRLTTIDPASGGNPAINALLQRERGPVFSGIKLVLTRYRAIPTSAVREMVA